MPKPSYTNDLRRMKTALIFGINEQARELDETQTRNIRRESCGHKIPGLASLHSNTASEVNILAHGTILQGALLQYYHERPLVKESIVNESNTKGNRQLAVVQPQTLLRFDRKTWAIRQGMTRSVARYKARKEILNAGVVAHILFKFRRVQRLNEKHYELLLIKECKEPPPPHPHTSNYALLTSVD